MIGFDSLDASAGELNLASDLDKGLQSSIVLYGRLSVPKRLLCLDEVQPTSPCLWPLASSVLRWTDCHLLGGRCASLAADCTGTRDHWRRR